VKARNAIVTLVVGAKLATIHRECFLPAWHAYGGRHGMDIVIIEHALDDSPRAASRSPAWQKLLVHAAPEARGYERLAWVDADVMIRPDAPDIFEAVPRGKVGAVDDFATPTREDHALVMDELYRRWDREGIRYASNRTAQEYYANYGLSCDFPSVVQTGVMVFEPAVHGGIFENVYRDYEEGADPSLNHEMRPLSFELLKAGVVHWLDPKFNMQWSYCRELHYPFLDRDDWVPLARWLGRGVRTQLLRRCVNTAYRNNYFLHFAGRSRDYALIDASETRGALQTDSCA
jgi:hypothetical protein